MALSEANAINIAQILGIAPFEVTDQIAWIGDRFTAAVQTAVEAQITLWTAGASTNYTDIEPNMANFGAKIRAESARKAIRERIAVLLERPDWASGSTGSQARLTRS